VLNVSVVRSELSDAETVGLAAASARRRSWTSQAISCLANSAFTSSRSKETNVFPTSKKRVRMAP